MTELDIAHAAMEADPGDDVARLKFYERLADTELSLLLEDETVDDRIRPQIFETEGHRFALVFDRPERLSDFADGAAVATAVLSGRALAQMLAGSDIGLALNPGVAPSAMVLPPEALGWLHDTLDDRAQETQARITALHPPHLPEEVLTGLDRKLAMTAGRARQAWLAQAAYDNDTRNSLLVFLDAAPGAEGALTQIAREALTFSGVEAGSLDIAFARSSDPIAARLAKVGLRFDLPEPSQTEDQRPAPGSDPNAPPILR